MNLLWKREKNQYQVIQTILQPKSNSIYLRMNATNGHTFGFEYSGDNKTWFKLNDKLEGKFLPPWDRGVRVSLTVGGIENA
ncbi:MAG: xylosidase, partial [Chitinophagaceae bacterium]